MTAALLVALVAAIVPGGWSGSTGPVSERVTRARVIVDVATGGRVVRPFVRVDLRGCRRTRTVHLRRSFGPAFVRGRRFVARARFSPPGRAMKVRLRLAGRFVSARRARGSVRGRLRYAGGRVCRIRRLTWVARPVGAPPPDESGADDFEDDEDFEDSEDFEDEFVPDDFDEEFEDDEDVEPEPEDPESGDDELAEP